MTLPLPNLDDREFRQLVEAAMAAAQKTCPAWTDASPADPGRALVEAFAYLTDAMIFRLNRLPDKLFVAFLNLLSGEMLPPRAATVSVVFSRDEGKEGSITIPAGTLIAGGGTPQAMFTTLQTAVIAPDAASTLATAAHAVWVEGELIGHATGVPGQVLQLKSGVVAALPGERARLLHPHERLRHRRRRHPARAAVWGQKIHDVADPLLGPRPRHR